LKGGEIWTTRLTNQILTTQIRAEIATCSETAYPSLPISSTKNLLFLDSEGAVISFAQSRGWLIKDGRIYFPNQSLKASVDEEGNEKELSQTAIENTLGYARELETIV
jgi:26S proteasome regulatory subunit N12